MKNTIKNKLIALVSGKMEMLTYREWNASDLRVTIARTERNEHNGVLGRETPRNWRHDWQESKTSTGGCYGRIFLGSENRAYFSPSGPDISFGDVAEYEHGARALKLIGKRLETINATRGYTQDVTDSMGRWLEACGITEVWLSADARASSWLSEGDWQQLTIGEFVNKIRRECLPAKTEPVAESVA